MHPGRAARIYVTSPYSGTGERNKKKQKREQGRGMLPWETKGEEEASRRGSLTGMGSPEGDESWHREEPDKEEEGG
jgi:hypothetical protein